MKKEGEEFRKKNESSLSELNNKLKAMVAYVNTNLDSIVQEDTTQGRDIIIEFKEGNSENFNAEVIHMAELFPELVGNTFGDNDWLVELYKLYNNGLDSTRMTSTYSFNPYLNELKENVGNINKLKYILIYRTAYKLEPIAKGTMFEIGADIENCFLFDMASGKIIRQFNLVSLNDQEVYYSTYENDAARTQSSFQSAITANLYSKLTEAMKKALVDRFEFKGNHRRVSSY